MSFFIIRENRTYDQVLGDMTDAAGKRLVMESRSWRSTEKKVTPNHHGLVANTSF